MSAGATAAGVCGVERGEVKGMVKGAKGGAPGEGKEGGKDGEGGEGEGGGREELTSEDKVAEMTTRATQLEASARSLMMENGRLRQVRESRLSLFGGTHEYHWTSTTGRVPLDEYHWTSTAGRVPLDEYHWIERNTQQPRNMTFCTLFTCSLIPDTPPPRTKRIRACPVSCLLSPFSLSHVSLSPCLPVSLSPVFCLRLRLRLRLRQAIDDLSTTDPLDRFAQHSKKNLRAQKVAAREAAKELKAANAAATREAAAAREAAVREKLLRDGEAAAQGEKAEQGKVVMLQVRNSQYSFSVKRHVYIDT